MKVTCTLLTPAAYQASEQERRSRLDAARVLLPPDMTWEEVCRQPEMRLFFREQWFPAGTMWLAPWIFDPAEDDPSEGRGMLSEFYFRDWAKDRAPIVVVCPGGGEWCVDRKASNGPGWKVTGDPPEITCHPSIKVRGYHGWLRDGVFSDPI